MAIVINHAKKTSKEKCIVIPKSMIKNNDGTITIAKTFLKEHSTIKMIDKDKKKYKNLNIQNDCRIIKSYGEYYLIVPLVSKINKVKTDELKYCGIDPGERTFMTCFTNNGCYEYEHDRNVIEILNKKIIVIYSGRFQPPSLHHYKTWVGICSRFGKENVYIATSNKIEPPKSPLTFEEKRTIWKAFGVVLSYRFKPRTPVLTKNTLAAAAVVPVNVCDIDTAVELITAVTIAPGETFAKTVFELINWLMLIPVVVPSDVITLLP
jgi:hypothetical protein